MWFFFLRIDNSFPIFIAPTRGANKIMRHFETIVNNLSKMLNLRNLGKKVAHLYLFLYDKKNVVILK